MILRNDIVNFCYIGKMAPAGDLLLVAEHTLERAALLRDEDRDGVMFQQFSLLTKIIMSIQIIDENY